MPIGGFAADPDDDLDGDGLPEEFENRLADAFAPEYHVSGGEEPGTGFRRFVDQPEQELVGPILGQNGPRYNPDPEQYRAP